MRKQVPGDCQRQGGGEGETERERERERESERAVILEKENGNLGWT